MEDYLASAYQQYSESLPLEGETVSEVEMTEFYPEMRAALYRCRVGEEETEVHVFAEKREGYMMASFLTDGADKDLRFLNILQFLEEVSSPETREGENGETFLYAFS